ncbi:MAG: Arm DNA-binding domain-containing protein [Armatimonadetes bacterium]|nr:Arm DNA-binding domain-containing protein [Armatimonadota bacterium]
MRGFVFNRNKNKKGKKPNWCYVVEFGYTAEGKRDRLWKGGFATKQEADGALTQVLEQLRTETSRCRKINLLGKIAQAARA